MYQDSMGAKGWLERIDQETKSAQKFWKKEANVLQEKSARWQDGQSSIATSTFINSDTTISTMVLRDKLKNIENEIAFEKSKRDFLQNQLSTISETSKRPTSTKSESVLKLSTPKPITPASLAPPKPRTPSQ
eukprot:CAMPEP_0177751140 /NCGR_PEP_ID=MMETSP0491_2-20121128/211_1 /TAXON_ID=63592 /ORGANISM="Tetraselmis chuii, Strain PLY429" /LENGTH=131 /DNA_ID=CAMNT_0019266225 /DNA_START=193 /DNA_END=588 /DNA_ORIENTATION=+